MKLTAIGFRKWHSVEQKIASDAKGVYIALDGTFARAYFLWSEVKRMNAVGATAVRKDAGHVRHVQKSHDLDNASEAGEVDIRWLNMTVYKSSSVHFNKKCTDTRKNEQDVQFFQVREVLFLEPLRLGQMSAVPTIEKSC